MNLFSPAAGPRRAHRRPGMSSLQAVILLGAGFVVAWGLMEVWTSLSGTTQKTADLTIRGQSLRPGSGAGQPGGPLALPPGSLSGGTEETSAGESSPTNRLVVPPGLPPGTVPIIDEQTGEVIGYRYSEPGYSAVYDINGKFVDNWEAGLETPLIDPIDLVGLGLPGLARGAIGAGLRGVGRVAAGLAGKEAAGAVGGAATKAGLLATTKGIGEAVLAKLRGVLGAKIPQGLTRSQFDEAAKILRSGVEGISDDVVVQGSRATGTAKAASDIDFGVRVSEEKFAELIKARFGTPNPGSAAERTMQHAIKTGKIQAGEAGLRGVRKELEKVLGMDVDVSIIRKGGLFDGSPTLPVPK